MGCTRDFFIATEFRNTQNVALPGCNGYPGGYILPEPFIPNTDGDTKYNAENNFI